MACEHRIYPCASWQVFLESDESLELKLLNFNIIEISEWVFRAANKDKGFFIEIIYGQLFVVSGRNLGENSIK